MMEKQDFELSNIAKFLSKLAENSESVYWLSSPDFKSIAYISPAYEKIWGRSREILYKNPEIWITYLLPEDAQNYNPITEMAKKVADLGENARYEENYRIVRPDGEIRWIIDRGFPIFDETGECCGVTGVAVDVTKEKQIEENLRQAKISAEAASQAKTDFIASMTHDTKIPLTGIIGLAKILERDAQSFQEKEHAKNILKCGNRLLELFTSILDNISADYANINDLHLEAFDIRQEIENLFELELLAVQAKKLELKTDIGDDVPKYIVADRVKLRQVLLNLIGNAIKFTDKGYIKISVQLISKSNETVDLKFGVKDTGVGIPENAQKKVFDKFFTVDPTYKGVHKGHGIGLNTVQLYTKLMGSEIKLDSKLGEGTTFYFIMSVKMGNLVDVKNIEKNYSSEKNEKIKNKRNEISLTQEVRSKSVKPILSANSNKGVLLVEDDVICSDIAKDMLQQLGYNVTSINNAESAFQLIKKEKYELILTDVGLPGMSGDEFVALLRYWEKISGSTRMPIVALTAHASNPIERNKLVFAGVDEVLGKPTNIDALKNAIHKLTSKANNDFKVIIDDVQMDYDTFLASQKPVTGLGFELPESLPELYQLDQYPLFDFDQALKLFDNSLESLERTLQSFLTQTLNKDIFQLNAICESNNWKEASRLAHRMKGTAGYVAATRIKYALQYLERYYLANHRDEIEMKKLYQQILKIAEETKLYIEKFMLEKKSKN